MLFRRLTTVMRGQRGVALPMALMCLLILTALIVAFSMMAASEPVLANNQLQVAQARAVAESGVERAIWALNNPANASGIPNPLAPAALTVRGEISAGGNSSIDSRSDTSCGNKAGSYSAGLTYISGSADIYGHDGNDVHNQLADAVQNIPDATFNQWTYSNADLNAL